MKNKELLFKIVFYSVIVIVNIILIIAVGKSITDVISSGDIEKHKEETEQQMEELDEVEMGEDYEMIDMEDSN